MKTDWQALLKDEKALRRYAINLELPVELVIRLINKKILEQRNKDEQPHTSL